MSVKGSGRRVVNRDQEKERKNWDKIDWSGPSSGKEVDEKDRPAGVRTRIVYGTGGLPVDYSNKYE